MTIVNNSTTNIGMCIYILEIVVFNQQLEIGDSVSVLIFQGIYKFFKKDIY